MLLNGAPCIWYHNKYLHHMIGPDDECVVKRTVRIAIGVFFADFTANSRRIVETVCCRAYCHKKYIYIHIYCLILDAHIAERFIIAPELTDIVLLFDTVLNVCVLIKHAKP